MGPSAADPTTEPMRRRPPAGTTRLRVAIDATPLMNRRTGVGVVTAALFAELERSGELDLHGYVVSWRARDRYRTAMPGGVTPLRLAWPARLAHRTWQRMETPRLAGAWDLVHGTNYVVPPVRSGARLVTVHDLTAWRFPELVDHHSRAYPALLRKAVTGGTHIHCVSDAVGREVVGELGVPPELVHVVPNGFDPVEPGDGEAARRRIDGPYILAVGTIEPRKDYAGLVRAMPAVWADHPGLKLVIVGGDGWGTEAFESAVRSAGAENRVLRVGYVSDGDKADLMAGAEMLVYPSVYEGFGLPVLEAMDHGLPVVATAVDAVVEVAGDGAELVAPGDVEQLSAAISAVLTDDRRRKRLIAAGRRRAADFSWDRTGAAMLDLYRELAVRVGR
ncbi:MAG: glycosyltransferase family 4 protein [Acidimicrobiia bacterium]|nr:glycosyltransferase family 4 protein [Acidimicrobiia bacterium]